MRLLLNNRELVLDESKIMFLSELDTLCFTDLHFGLRADIEEKRTFMILQNLIKKYSPKRIVGLGDYKADDSILVENYESELQRILNFLASNCDELVLVRGNTDKSNDLLGFKLINEFSLNGMTFAHGHQPQFLDRIENSEMLILGMVTQLFLVLIHTYRAFCTTKTRFCCRRLPHSPNWATISCAMPSLPVFLPITSTHLTGMYLQ